MADGAAVSDLLRRVMDLEPNELDLAVALYADCIDVFGRAASGDPNVPGDIVSMLVRKFEDPKPFVDRCAELAKAS